MHCGVDLALGQPDSLVAFLAILIPDRRNDEQIRVVENPGAEGKRKAML
jgi:hypothetical protein